MLPLLAGLPLLLTRSVAHAGESGGLAPGSAGVEGATVAASGDRVESGMASGRPLAATTGASDAARSPTESGTGPAAPARTCDWMKREWSRLPITDPAERARVLADLHSPDEAVWSCAVVVIGAHAGFTDDLPRFLGPPDPVTGIRPTLPGADPEEARVLQARTHGPLWNTAPLWEGAGPAGRFAVILDLDRKAPGACAVLDEAAFDPITKVEREADRRRGSGASGCPLGLDLVPRLLASDLAHTRTHAVYTLRDALPHATDREVSRDRCEGDPRPDRCRELRALPPWRWSHTERRAWAGLVDIAAGDPDATVREAAAVALSGAHLGPDGPLAPLWLGEDYPEDGGCGGE